jgi:polyhydroxyalkanoate synthesis regulator phasin
VLVRRRSRTSALGGGEVKTGREQYLQALASLRELTRTQAERVAALLAKQGEAPAGQASRIAEDLLRRTRKNREQFSRLIEREVKRQLGAAGIATRDEVARLQQRVRALEQVTERASRPAGARTRAAASRTRTPRTSARPASGTRRGRGTTKATDTGAGGVTESPGHPQQRRRHGHRRRLVLLAPGRHRRQLDVPGSRCNLASSSPTLINPAYSAVSRPAA